MTDRRRHFPIRCLALGLAFAALAAPAAATPNETSSPAQPISPPPKVGEPMHWFHSPLSARRLQGGGSVSARLRCSGSSRCAISRRYERLRLRPSTCHPRAARGRSERRFHAAPVVARERARRSPSPLRLSRSVPSLVLGTPNDPLLWMADPVLGIPYEWQFGAAGMDRALEPRPGARQSWSGRSTRASPAYPIWRARSMGAGRSSTGWNRWRPISTTAPATAPRWRR